ncbi:MAG: methyltransferase domain-containing protein [Candidatus Nitrohelix vancouverensis]|uniref:Methyltransferase domain-containing protein n=1 Tax=Candidatus Nitrohelix vancouverensis TaxID=2705534 RepID=A0A7T0C3D6_9BACT|nr:MAG: methyltransferase domain-containing protein [Candidatus Nitrohelix vancouverensis]
MLFSAPPRNLRPELLDLDEAPFEEVRKSLKDVRRVNRYLSGYRVLLHYAEELFRSHNEKRPLTILDLATGSADQPLALLQHAKKMKVEVRITAVDINRKMLDYAREETGKHKEIDLVQGDILSLPFADSSFDLVVNSLSLHHFSSEHAVAILKSAMRVARRRVVINDLNRSRIAFGAIWILTRLLTTNRLTRYDAPVSVMNAFTPSEMTALAQDAGYANFKVHRHFPYRIALVGEK